MNCEVKYAGWTRTVRNPSGAYFARKVKGICRPHPQEQASRMIKEKYLPPLEKEFIHFQWETQTTNLFIGKDMH